MSRLAGISIFLLLWPTAAASGRAQGASDPLYLKSAIFPRTVESVAAAESKPAAASAMAFPLPKYGSWVGVTKWVTLGASVGFGALGAVMHHQADKEFRRLERLCEANPQPCREFDADGSYASPVLEDMYQSVLSNDNVARFSWIAAQLSFGATVVLFIVDFQRSPGPGDIPYEPPDEDEKRLELSAVPGELTIRYYIQ